MNWNGLTRRGFLGTSAAGAAALVAAGGWFWWEGDAARYRAMVGGAVPTVLSVTELAILGAICDTVITVAPGAPSVAEAETARRIDRELMFHEGSPLVSDVKLALALLEHLPALDFLGVRFTELSTADRTRFLHNCEASAWNARRQAFAGIKFLIFFFYYTDARTWHSIGYAGPQVTEKFYEGGNAIANLSPLKRAKEA